LPGLTDYPSPSRYNVSHMDTNFLANFIVVVETGSIAEASRRLNVSPTALAQQIKALEKELGSTLIARAGRNAAPTVAGNRLAAYAKAVLYDISQMREIVAAPQQATEFRLGTINTPLQSFVPDTLALLAEKNPRLSVFIKTGHAGQLLEDVGQGDVDAAIIPHPQFDLPKSLIWKELCAEPLILLATSRLARLDPHELLATQPFIRYDRQHWGGRLAERYLRQAGIVPHERFELSSLITISIMVDRNLGVALVPDAMLPVPDGLRLAKLSLPIPFEPRRIGVVWRRSSALGDIAQQLAGCAGHALSKRRAARPHNRAGRQAI